MNPNNYNGGGGRGRGRGGHDQKKNYRGNRYGNNQSSNRYDNDNYHNQADAANGFQSYSGSRGYARGSNSYRGRGEGSNYRGRPNYNRGGNNVGNAPQDVSTILTNNAPQVSVEDDLSTWRQKDFNDLVKAFVNNTNSKELTFPPNLTPAQRNSLHKIATFFGLDHKSHGSGEERRLTISKITDENALKRLTENASEGVRTKTIEGYQGAQLLPEDFLQNNDLESILTMLFPLQKMMYKEISIECNKPSPKRRINAVHSGLSSAPQNSNRDKQRFAELQKFRQCLPTYKRKDDIIEHVRSNDVVIVCGDTGCGKTTQIPQLLYDSGIFPHTNSIICTQPRRISALSVAIRVAQERGEPCGGSCGYIIRFENVTSPSTKIVYATTGILLRRLHTEPDLNGVSCVVVDEVHERDVETDFCLLLLRDRLREQRDHPERFKTKLKVVVMSATVQIESLIEYFAGYNGAKTVPLIRIPGTLFPVDEFFLEDALTWIGAKNKTSFKIGNISSSGGDMAKKNESSTEDLYSKLKSSVFNDAERDAEQMIPFDVVVKLIEHIHRDYSRRLSESILIFLPGWGAIARIMTMLRNSNMSRELSVLALHSSLTTREQQRVFDPPPRNFRKVVLATSIAETSITIDDIVYVIDGGLIKGTSYDPVGNMSSLKASLISKANGVQRRGRAGRCQAGVCVHLLPKSLYDSLPDFLPPDIVRSPLEEVCLQIKAIRPEELCADVLSRAMDAPPSSSVKYAVESLTEMGALTEKEEQLTNLGRALAQLPVHPLLGKMLFAAACFGVLDPVSTIAAGLSVKSVFVRPQHFERDAALDSIHHLDNGDLSDHLCVLKVYQGWVRSGRSVSYAQEHFADPTTLRSLERTKRQLLRFVVQSPLVRRMQKPEQAASRYRSNLGLVRLVILWSLYPRIATTEYRANRPTTTPNIYCWDNKPCVLNIGALYKMKKNDFASRTFIMYFDRMQVESQLNLHEGTAVSPVDVALCLRQLTVRPLLDIPEFLLHDEESVLAPPQRLNLDSLENKEEYSAMFFDGDKKVYIAHRRVALALQIARECMDYYLALCIKKLRADAFPTELVRALSLAIGYPLGDEELFDPNNDFVETGEFSGEDAKEEVAQQGNLPAFARGGGWSESEDSDDDGPVVLEGDDMPTLELTEEQRSKVTAAFGDLAIFRRDGAKHILDAAANVPVLKNIVEEKEATEIEETEIGDACEEGEDDDDIIVIPAGDLM